MAFVESRLLRILPNGETVEVLKAGVSSSVSLVAVDDQNNLWLSGSVPITPDAPIRSCATCGAIAMFDASGNAVFGTASPVNADRSRVSNGVFYIGNSSAGAGEPTVAIVDRAAAPEPILASISDVDPRGFSLVPGNVLALNGGLIGPETDVYRPLDRNGHLATEVSGYRVLFDDHPAPIWAASRDRWVVQVPIGNAEPWKTLTIVREGKPIVARPLVGASISGPIILAGPVLIDPSFVIRNEDGTANSLDNPAPLGSVVRFLVAGVGETDPPLVEGEVTHSALAKPKITPAVSFSLGTPLAEVISYQQAADQPAGIMEMRVRLPRTFPANDPARNAWSLFFVDPRLQFPVTSQFPLSIYVRQ